MATLATLAYLALQIRQNTRSVRTATFQSSIDSINRINALIASDPAMARVFREGNENFDSLSDDERTQFNFLYLSYFHVFENMHFQGRQGTGAELWLSVGKDVGPILSTPGARNWWETNPYTFRSEFREYVEEAIKTAEGSSN